MSEDARKNNRIGEQSGEDEVFEVRDATLFELFIEFFKLGMFTIGGGITMIPLLQGIVSDRKKWMTPEETVDCIAVAQSLPGVIAINMATYVGHRKKGALGAVVATTGIMLPSLISIILVIEVLKWIGDNKYINGALTGIRAAATGLIAYSAYSVGKKVLKDTFGWVVAAAAFILITFLDISVVYVVVGSIIAGLIMYKMTGGGADASGKAASGGEAGGPR